MGVVRRGSALRSEIAERGFRLGVMAEKLDRHCLPAVPDGGMGDSLTCVTY